MKRIDVAYGGHSYSIGGRDLDELRADILAHAIEGPAYWLEVNSGEGEPRPTFLLISPGTPIALTPIPGDADAASSDAPPL